MADNPYSPYVDRTGGSTSWGANPTAKRGPQYFPPLPAFKPYASVASANSGFSSMLSQMVDRLRTTPTSVSGAGAGSGASGRGADASGMSVQGIAGIQSIPTLGGITGTQPESPPATDPASGGAISPDSTDIPPVDAQPPGTGTGDGQDILNRLRAVQEGGTKSGIKRRVGPQY